MGPLPQGAQSFGIRVLGVGFQGGLAAHSAPEAAHSQWDHCLRAANPVCLPAWATLSYASRQQLLETLPPCLNEHARELLAASADRDKQVS